MSNRAKKIVILGSTGSVGCNTLRVVESLEGQFEVVGLAAGKYIELLIKQIIKFQPEIVSVATEELARQLNQELKASGPAKLPEITCGQQGLVDVATYPDVDMVISATVGSVGFVPTYRALEIGRRVALANKETLVMAGELMIKAAAASGAELLPVDSEHNAIHQCLRGERREEVRRLILTASGGPFRNLPLDQLRNVTPKQALKHPVWNMGAKITIDSATLMNKGLEVIEAGWLFGFGPDQIDIVIHPRSTIHSMVEMVDGSIIAQMGVPDMRHAIQYAMTYPQRFFCDVPRLDLAKLRALEFFSPDTTRFPCIRLAYEAMRAGGTLPAAMSAANEVAVEAFINRRISFPTIPQIIEEVMLAHKIGEVTDISTVLEVDAWARARCNEIINQLATAPAHP